MKRARRDHRRRWGNLTGDLKVLDLKGQKWVNANGVLDETRGYLEIEDQPVSNAHLAQTSRMVSDRGQTSQGRRTKDSFAVEINQRGMLKHLYGGHVSLKRLRASMLKQLKGHTGSLACEDGTYTTPYSFFAYGEMQLDVVLWRSGLAKTRGESHQMCSHGHVEVTFPKKTKVTMKHPSCSLVPGTLVQVKPSVWAVKAPKMRVYWSDEANDRTIPSYLLVSRRTGTVVMDRVPRDGEVLMPHARQRSVNTLVK